MKLKVGKTYYYFEDELYVGKPRKIKYIGLSDIDDDWSPYFFSYKENNATKIMQLYKDDLENNVVTSIKSKAKEMKRREIQMIQYELQLAEERLERTRGQITEYLDEIEDHKVALKELGVKSE